MRPTWLIEAGVYGAEADPLLAEIRRQGMAAELLPHRTLLKEKDIVAGDQPLADGDCVLAYGTFPFARQVQLHRRWIPGAWCDAANLDCSCYFARFEKYLLNQHHAIMPAAEAIRQRDRLYEMFGPEDEVFARPTGCNKVFTGRCIHRDDFASALSPATFDPDAQVVVAAPKEVGREWRLVVVADGRVVAASQYAVEGSKCVEPGCPDEVNHFAEVMLAEVNWRPDPIFMLDVCESAGRLWLVEISGFSCSWLYECDVRAVVATAGELAATAGAVA